jgi:hypothetical protein
MYIVKAFYTNGASSAQHDEIPLAWAAFSHTVQVGLKEGNLVRAEIWDIPDNLVISHKIRSKRCPLAVFDLALMEETTSPTFREIELSRGQNEKAI